MYCINFKPLTGKDGIRRKLPQSFPKHKGKEGKGNK